MKTDKVTTHEDQNMAPAATENRYTFTPKVDIWETTEAVHLDAEMPGVDEKSIDINLEDGVLTLLGRVTPPDFANYQRTYAEYEVGNFERSFRVTDAIDEAKIKATLKHGLLHVELPKREAVKPRRIEVAVA